MKQVHPKTRKDWRAWLEKNHDKEDTVFLVRHKRHTGKPAVSPKEAMDEAICFGWIDTTVKRIDENKWGQTFRKRTAKSRWSKATQGHARRLIKEKRMAPAGLAAYKAGLKKPVIDLDLPKNPKTPEDLKAALQKVKGAEENFKNFAPSYRKMYIYWVERAVRPETRKKRIKEVVKKSKENKTWGK